MGSIGETIADTLKFFNVAQPSGEVSSSAQTSSAVAASQQQATTATQVGSNGGATTTNPKFKEIKKVELQ